MVLKNYIEKYADGGKSDAKSRQKEAYDFFLEKGLTPAQASGIVGNLMQESYADLRTNVVGDKQLGPKGESYGIAQWRLDRKDNLFKVRPEDHDTLKGQLEFIWWELNNTEKKAFNKLIESKTPSEAAYNFGLRYERPKTVEGSRLKNAQSVYSNFYSEQPNMSEQFNTVVNSEGLTKEAVINNDFIPFETKDNISTFTPNIDFLKFDKIQALEAERAKRQEEIMENLSVMADTPEKKEEVQQMEEFSLGFDPYNYISIEEY